MHDRRCSARTAPDTSYHDRRLARRLKEDPEFAAEFERQRREIAAIDGIVNKLDDLRAQHGFSKADLAREIGKNPAAIRRCSPRRLTRSFGRSSQWRTHSTRRL